MPVRKDGITVEYQNGKKVVHFSRNAQPGRNALDDYRMLCAVANELGAGVSDPYDKILPALKVMKNSEERMAKGLEESLRKTDMSIFAGYPSTSVPIQYMGTAYYSGMLRDEARRRGAIHDLTSMEIEALHKASALKDAIDDLSKK